MSESGSPLTVGITGPRGFIAGHLTRRLVAGTSLNGPFASVSPCSRQTLSDKAAFFDFVEGCNTIVHLVGMSRGNEREIYDINTVLVDRLIEALEATNCRPHVVFPS